MIHFSIISLDFIAKFAQIHGHMGFKIFSLSAGLSTYPFKFPLILSFGVGAKHKDEKWKPFIRGVANYDFHIGEISLGPMVMYDVYFSSPDIFSPGITVGFGL